MKTILVIDDSDFERVVLKKGLQLKGEFAIIEANSGAAGLKVLETQQVDLVLLDIVMPDATGFDVLLQIRKTFNQLALPVLMVSAISDDTEIVSCLQNGANDFITKPVNFTVAVSRINTHIRFAELSIELGKVEEKKAIDSMIATYNHEINNPLAIAIGFMKDSSLEKNENREKIRRALWRISEIVKKISHLTEKSQSDKKMYSKTNKVYRID